MAPQSGAKPIRVCENKVFVKNNMFQFCESCKLYAGYYNKNQTWSVPFLQRSQFPH